MKYKEAKNLLYEKVIFSFEYGNHPLDKYIIEEVSPDGRFMKICRSFNDSFWIETDSIKNFTVMPSSNFAVMPS